MVLPRYFAPRAGGEPCDVPTVIAHVIDSFMLTCGPSAAEWVVGLDLAGKLAVRPLEPADTLPVSLRKQLAFHEVSGGLRREIELDTLYLFEMRLLEQAPDCPGVNDPVYLYGTLVGPRSASVRPPKSPTSGASKVSSRSHAATCLRGWSPEPRGRFAIPTRAMDGWRPR